MSMSEASVFLRRASLFLFSSSSTRVDVMEYIFPKNSSGFPLLHAMEEKGYLQAVWEAEGGRGRKVYQITARGEEFLTAGARAAEEFLKRIQYEAEIGPFQAKHA